MQDLICMLYYTYAFPSTLMPLTSCQPFISLQSIPLQTVYSTVHHPKHIHPLPLTQRFKKRYPKFLIDDPACAQEFFLGAMNTSEFGVETGGDVVPILYHIPWRRRCVALHLDVDEEVDHPFLFAGGEESAVVAVVTG